MKNTVEAGITTSQTRWFEFPFPWYLFFFFNFPSSPTVLWEHPWKSWPPRTPGAKTNERHRRGGRPGDQRKRSSPLSQLSSTGCKSKNEGWKRGRRKAVRKVRRNVVPSISWTQSCKKEASDASRRGAIRWCGDAVRIPPEREAGARRRSVLSSASFLPVFKHPELTHCGLSYPVLWKPCPSASCSRVVVYLDRHCFTIPSCPSLRTKAPNAYWSSAMQGSRCVYDAPDRTDHLISALYLVHFLLANFILFSHNEA